MRFSHILFNSPSHIAFRLDCVNGGSGCNSGSTLDPNDDCWDHGTSSGAIITANNRSGNDFRGVTAITLDSFKVYPTSFSAASGLCNGNLSVTAAVRGFQRAVAVLDRVIVAEMQAGGSDTSSISAAADNAFDAGAVIIAANGNNGPAASTVNEPAIAHKVIGVGNFDVQTLNQINGQSRGPAPDNRIKPDIQAPTNTETAGNGCGWQQNCTAGGSDTAINSFGGTSGANAVRRGRSGAVAQLAARHQLQHRSGTGLCPAHPLRPAALSVQQHQRRRPASLAHRRLGVVGQGLGKRRGNDRHSSDISGGSPNTLDGALWWPGNLFAVPVAQRHRSAPGRSQRNDARLEPLHSERVRACARGRFCDARDLEDPHTRVQCSYRFANGLLGRACPVALMRQGTCWRAGMQEAWKLLACVLAASLLSTQAVSSANARSGTDGSTPPVRIYAGADWYQSRPEPERHWRGILRRRPVVEGPGSRTALTFALDTGERTYPVYAAGVESELAPFAGRWVEVEGKLVDLGDEGFGEELWIATARSIDGANQ